MHTLRDRRLVECNQTLVELLGLDSRQELMSMEADRLFEDPTEYTGLVAEADRGSAPVERDLAVEAEAVRADRDDAVFVDGLDPDALDGRLQSMASEMGVDASLHPADADVL